MYIRSMYTHCTCIYICTYLLTCTDFSLYQEICKEGCKFSVNQCILCNICNIHYIYKYYECQLRMYQCCTLTHMHIFMQSIYILIANIIYPQLYLNALHDLFAHLCSQMLISRAICTYIGTYMLKLVWIIMLLKVKFCGTLS